MARWLAVLLAAALLGGAVLSCQPLPDRHVGVGECRTCLGTGRFGKGTCPTCQGLGFIRFRSNYPVIDPYR